MGRKKYNLDDAPVTGGIQVGTRKQRNGWPVGYSASLPALVPDHWYTILEVERDGNSRYVYTPRKLRLVRAFKHHVLFENARHIRRCYIWWDLARLLVEEGQSPKRRYVREANE